MRTTNAKTGGESIVNYSMCAVSLDTIKSAICKPSKSFYSSTRSLFETNSCQFVVLDSADYGAHVRDPDLLVDWDNIQELVSLLSV